MSILVIRPHPHGEDLCKQLDQHGLPAIHLPLVRFNRGRDCPKIIPLTEQSQIIIAVSQQAVMFSHEYLTALDYKWPEHIRYLAIGQKTAQLLSKFTQQPVNYPGISDSEHFIGLPELQNLSGISIVILRGNSGRELIAQELKKRGAKINYCEVYQREMVPFNAEKMVQQWQNAAIDHIVVTSASQLSFFVSQIPDFCHPWLFDRILLVPGLRIEEIAQNMGFKHIIVVGSASNSDLVAALQPQKE
ncbi:Uroporphyrinogen-III synthase [Vibrio aerogenes CECT 7868]|uniref:Uroporphyrinogen-III synthase n=1 Tax=Vibrio aerogenes CECT 7868 TaxID=1216006 RepID=A0A1M5ZEZ9_9VIBR|nr:uroporphyrinogen-III synthase [Vibrio aerogenes]SHI22808.1 Uroporphyrinogen-III synthase [Vibrio aerogenes CECT 7868]